MFRIITEFGLRNRVKPLRTSVKINSTGTEIWTGEVPNVKQECQPLHRDTSCFSTAVYKLGT
jgi:hypothetical protein